MSKNTPNPLDLLDCRKLEFIPEHFETVDVQYKYNVVSALDKWIRKNLKGRYAISKAVVVPENKPMDTAIRVGFENPTEASYFMLACPLLKYHN